MIFENLFNFFFFFHFCFFFEGTLYRYTCGNELLEALWVLHSDGVGASPAWSLTGDQLVEIGVGDEPSIPGCICGKKAVLLSLTSAENALMEM